MMSPIPVGRPFGGSGLALPPMGLGSAPLGNVMGPVSDADAADVLKTVTGEAGPALIDTAPFYGFGSAESRIGDLLSAERKSSVLLSTKVGRVLATKGGETTAHFDFSYDGVMRSFEESLQRLGRDAIDIVHIHDPDAHFDQAVGGAFPALVKLKETGAIQAISAGMNQWEMLSRLLDSAPFDGFMLAGRYSLLDRGAEHEFLPKCQRHGAGLIVGGVFNSGILADPKTNQSFNYTQAPREILNRVLSLERVCREHGVPLKAAALQFPLRHAAVSSIVVGVKSRAEWQENQVLLDFPVSDAAWTDLDQVLESEMVPQ